MRVKTQPGQAAGTAATGRAATGVEIGAVPLVRDPSAYPSDPRRLAGAARRRYIVDDEPLETGGVESAAPRGAAAPLQRVERPLAGPVVHAETAAAAQAGVSTRFERHPILPPVRIIEDAATGLGQAGRLPVRSRLSPGQRAELRARQAQREADQA